MPPLLNSAGIITATLSEPVAAMDALTDFQPDLLILDMDMPACSGPDLARAIRFNDQYLNLPLLYLSERDDLDHLIAALSEGDDDFLAKPVQPGPQQRRESRQCALRPRRRIDLPCLLRPPCRRVGGCNRVSLQLIDGC